ncbi:NAD+ diphosphatase [Trichococcus patagoniensis]|uniref:NAD(+) diphosphatase n=1 Tax=Trichococcus patagoniensis TaxID=382641 RepID=A0A2T5IDV8_9LACT|nr:NUDIX domain-containing protein [Trichococcus patagoniensis]PTQ82010.1 NAD+ diphosphatase [Trichococcus patagoniensis]
MNYCMECGTELEGKYLENEGMIPYCKGCEGYRFPVFNTAVSMIILNQAQNKILLIKQYGGTDYILCAGYLNKGENAEQAAAREIAEELGIEVIDWHYNKSEYFEKTNTLMLNFSCTVANERLDGMTDEVDQAEWFSIEDARLNIKNGSLAQRFLENYLEKSHGREQCHAD